MKNLLLIIICITGIANTLQAQTTFTAIDGPGEDLWSEGESWLGGVSPGNIISTGDSVVIPVGVLTTIDISITNQGTITNNGDLTIESLFGETLTNYGDLTNYGTIVNERYGTLINESGATLINESGATLNNIGTLTNNGDLTNYGTIVNESDATLINESGATLINESGATLNNIGKLTNKVEGTLTNNGDLTNIGTIVNKREGTITNNGDLTNYGTLRNESEPGGPGTLGGAGTLTNNGDLTNYLILDNQFEGTLTNNGTLENKSEGTLTNDGTLTNSFILYNRGTLANREILINESGGFMSNLTGGTLTNTRALNNFGTLQNRHTLINESGVLTGALNNFGTLTILTNNGNITNKSGGTITNFGTLNHTQGTIFNNSGGTITNNLSAVITVNGGRIYNTGTLTNNGNITYNLLGRLHNESGGNVTNNGSMTSIQEGVLTSGGYIVNFSGGTLTNTGTITNWNTLINESGGTLTNDSGGILNNYKTLQNTGTLQNIGTLTNTPSATLTNEFGGTLTNFNTLTIESGGTLINKGFLTNESGGTLINIGSGNLTNNLEGTLTNNGFLTNEFGGTLTNYGTLLGVNTSHTGNFSNAGIVSPGNSIGTYTFNTGYTHQSTAILTTEIESTSNFDAVTVTAAATLSGTLDVSLVNGFTPSTGDTFTILTANSISGTFTTINFPVGYNWNINYTATEVILEVSAPTFTAPADVCEQTGIQNGLDGGLPIGGVYSGPGVTDDGNGMTYSFNPTTLGVGTHTITYTLSGNSAMDDIEVIALPVVTFTTPADICIDAGIQTGLSGGTPAVSITSTSVSIAIEYEVDGFQSSIIGNIVFNSSGAMVSTDVTANNDANGSTTNLVNATALGATITLDFGNGSTGTIVGDAPIIGASGNLTFSGSNLVIDGDVFDFFSGTGTATTETVGSGIYAGPGVTNEASGTLYSFDPAAAGTGIHTITYTFTDDNGCAASASDTIEVFALPAITFTAPDDVCVSAGVQTGLGNATPSGGIYTGPGVTDDGNGMTYSFDPAIAGVGTHTITYEFSDANSCSNTASNTIEVTAIEDPSFSYDASVYTGDDTDPTPTIIGVAGGVFSAAAGLILNPATGTIDVSMTTPGTYAVTYTTPGICMNSSSVNITINVGVLTQLDPAFCGVTLVTFDQNFTCEVVPGATQYDFQLTNQATSIVTISSNTEASNSLALANLFDFGATYDVRVRATVDGVAGPYGAVVCLLTAPNSCAVPVTLITPPEICIDAGIQVLSGGTTAGGVYSGPGVTDDGNGMTYSFDPVIAGLGSHTITYNFTDAIGCTDTATNTIAVVIDTVVAAFTAPADVCVDSGVQTDLTGGTPEGEVTTTTVFFSNDFVDPNGFTGYLSVAGIGITFDSSGALLFPPNGAFFRDNTQNIEYDLVDASASGSEILLDFGEFGFGNVILDRIVLESPDISGPVSEFSVAIISATIVINGVSYVLDGMNEAFSFNQSTGAGSGVYSGPGVTHDPFAMTYDFDPAVAGVGVHTITYTYTAPNGCSDTATDTIEVFDVPTVTFTAPGDLLLDAGVQSGLGGGTPIGSLASTTIVFDNVVFERPNFPDGIMNGTSVVDASGTLISTNVTFFHPSASQIPRPLEDLSVTGSEISLDFGTSTNGTFIHTGTITAVGPVLGTTGVVNTSGGALSYNGFIFSLAPNTVFTTTSVNSGVYSGPGVTDDGNGMTYSFDPVAAGVGTHTISYTYADVNGCSSSASDTVVVFIDTCQDIATYDAAGWGAVMPTINNEVIIDADYDTSVAGLDSFEACKVTVNTGATLTIAADDFIFVYGDITVETGASLIVAHTGSVVQVDDAAIVTNNGTINVNVTTPTLAARDFMIAGSPMTIETREDVYASAYRMHKHNTLDFFPHPDVDAYYAPATVANFADDNFNNWTPQTGILNPGEGYLVSPQGNNTEGGMTYDLTFEQGTLNNGEVTFGLDFHVDQNSSPSIIANPYASAIDAEAFINANSQINEVYFWEHITYPDAALPGANNVNYSMQDISMYNLSGGIGAGTAATNGGTTPNGFIATSQGFGVKATAAGTATFNNAMRVTTGNTTLRTTETNRDRVWLTLESTTYGIASETLIAFTDSATAGFDAGYDSEQIAKFVSVYSHIDNDNSLLGIQTREALTEDKEVSLGFSTQNEEVDTYMISIKELEGSLIESYTVYLEDHELGAITELSKTDYAFTASEGVYNNRFTLRFTDRNVLDISEVSLSQISVSPNPTEGVLHIASPSVALNSITISDMQGRLIRQELNVLGNSYTIDISEMSSAVYFIKIDTDQGAIVKRIVKK